MLYQRSYPNLTILTVSLFRPNKRYLFNFFLRQSTEFVSLIFAMCAAEKKEKKRNLSFMH